MAAEVEKLPVRVTWGYTRPASPGDRVTVEPSAGVSIGAIFRYRPGANIDGIEFILEFPRRTEPKLQKLQVIWADLLAAADADTARRLGNDAAMYPHAPRLYVRTGDDGTGGFAVTIGQLMRERAIWVPSLRHLHQPPASRLSTYTAHMASLKPWQGRADSPADRKRSPRRATRSSPPAGRTWAVPCTPIPQQTGAGHIIGLAWDSSIHKFGIDRGAGVRNDLGNPDRFRFWFEFGDITKGIARTWKSQTPARWSTRRTHDISSGNRSDTTSSSSPSRWMVRRPAPRRHRMVLLQRLRLSSLDGKARRVAVTLNHRRASSAGCEPCLRTGATTGAHNHRQE